MSDGLPWWEDSTAEIIVLRPHSDDGAGTGSEFVGEPVTSPRWSTMAIAFALVAVTIVALLSLGALATESAVPEAPIQERPEPTATAVAAAPARAAARFAGSGVAAAGPGGFAPWPDPPQDHDPHIIGRPGAGLPLLGEESNMTLVYVSTSRRPVVLNLDTGSTQELDIAETRDYESFLVEFGSVVGHGARNLNEATERAVPFHLHQTPPPGTNIPSGTPAWLYQVGPHLCLDAEACIDGGWQTVQFLLAGDTVSRLDANELPEIDALLGADDWVKDDRFWTWDSADAGRLRIPAPDGGTVWVIHQVP